MTALITTQSDIRLITTADYHRMAEVGILAANERVELIAGQIIQKMPKGPCSQCNMQARRKTFGKTARR